MNTEKTKAEIDAERLADFKKVLTFHLVTKIKHHFKSRVDWFYKAPAIWKLFREHKLNTQQKLNPWSFIAKYNDAGLSRSQVKAIFGRYPNEKSFTIPYSKLIESDEDITTRKHGTLVVPNKQTNEKRRFGVNTCYMLPKEYIQSIFDDKALLKKVCDAGSDFYTDRQRRLIFTQIAKQKNYHYKTNKELIANLSEEEKIASVLEELV